MKYWISMMGTALCFWGSAVYGASNLHMGDDLSAWLPRTNSLGLWVILKSQDQKTLKTMQDLHDNIDSEYRSKIKITLTLCQQSIVPASLSQKFKDWDIRTDAECHIGKKLGIIVFPTFIIYQQLKTIKIHSSLTALSLSKIEDELSAQLQVPSLRERIAYAFEDSEQKRKTAQELLLKAKESLKNSKPREAQNILNHALQIFTNCYSCNLLLAIIAMEESKLDDAKKYFQAVLDRSPQHAGALLGLGLIYLQTRYYSLAFHILQKSQELDSHFAWGKYALSQVCQQLPSQPKCQTALSQKYPKPSSYQELWP